MGVDETVLAFLRYGRSRGVDFRSTCTIGRQTVTVGGRGGTEPADHLFRCLGARRIEALDVSDYEGATLLHDLNSADLPETTEAFSAVVDGGSLEHIFHVPHALRSILSLVDIGGHVLFVNPTDGHSGHGFYQFSPEFFYRVLSPENGFELVSCLYKEAGRRAWYDVPDPAAVHRRVYLNARTSAYLFVIGKRVGPVGSFQPPPQQSDYVTAWGMAGEGRRLRLDRLPPRLRPAAYRLRNMQQLAIRPWLSPRRAGLERVHIG